MENLDDFKAKLRQFLKLDLPEALKLLEGALPLASGKAQSLLMISGDFADLQKHILAGNISQDKIQERNSDVRFRLSELVESLKDSDFVANTAAKAQLSGDKPKFALIYHDGDHIPASELKMHLNILVMANKIELYDVNTDPTGGDPVGEAAQACESADFFLVLITAKYFASKWKTVVEKALSDNKRVVPIRLKKLDYEGTGLDKLNPIPTRGRAVSDFDDPDEAYTDIVSEIKRLIDRAKTQS
jgi:hypothetical protein